MNWKAQLEEETQPEDRISVFHSGFSSWSGSDVLGREARECESILLGCSIQLNAP